MSTSSTSTSSSTAYSRRPRANRVAVIVTQVLGNVEKETLRRKMLAISQADRLALEQRILMRHQIILSAIELGDAEGAREAMIEHSRAADQDLPV